MENLKTNSAVEMGKKYTYAEKVVEWEQEAIKYDQAVVELAVKLMKMMDDGPNTKKVNAEFEKLVDASQKEQVMKLLTNFGKYGPEMAYERYDKAVHGKVDRTNEYVQGLFRKMDENMVLRGREKEQ